VAITHRQFDNHAAQWNYGLSQIETPWVLALDADYVCPESLSAELRQLTTMRDAYEASFRYCIEGKPLRGALYPPRVVLFRSGRFRYRQDGHTQLLDISEKTGRLQTVILHDDRKPLSRWLEAQARYVDLEAKKLLDIDAGELSWKDRLRKKVLFAPLLTFTYCLFYKRLILDGWPGIYYTLQRTFAELLLSLKLVESRLKQRVTPREEECSQMNSQFPAAGGDSIADGVLRANRFPKSAPETPPTFDKTKTAEQQV
jgi:hypothetical protein